MADNIARRLNAERAAAEGRDEDQYIEDLSWNAEQNSSTDPEMPALVPEGTQPDADGAVSAPVEHRNAGDSDEMGSDTSDNSEEDNDTVENLAADLFADANSDDR